MFGDIQPDAIDRNGALNQVKKAIKYLSAWIVQQASKKCQKFVIALNPVAAACVLVHFPNSGDLCSLRACAVLTAVYEDLPSLPADVLCDGLYPLADGVRGSRNRLPDVDTPVLVRGVWNVDAYAGETTGLFSCPSTTFAEAEPTAGRQEPLLPIDIEALLAIPSIRAARPLKVSFVSEAIPMWEDKATHTNSTARSFDRLLWTANGCLVCFEKRVPGAYAASVNIDQNVPGVAVQKSVKDHSEMAIETFDIRQKRCMIGPVLLAAEVDFPPRDESSSLAAGKFRERI